MTDEKTGSEKEKDEDCCGGGKCGCHGHGGYRGRRCGGLCLGVLIGLVLACLLGGLCRMWMGCRYSGMHSCSPAQTQMAPVQK